MVTRIDRSVWISNVGRGSLGLGVFSRTKPMTEAIVRFFVGDVISCRRIVSAIDFIRTILSFTFSKPRECW